MEVKKKKTDCQKKIVYQQKKKYKSIYIPGDSMMKYVEGWKLSKSTGKDHNVYVRSFSEAMLKCMKDYGKPCICEKNSDNLILHVGTNELNSELPLRE